MAAADTGHHVVKFGSQHHLFELQKSAEDGRLSTSQLHWSVLPLIGQDRPMPKVSWQQIFFASGRFLCYPITQRHLCPASIYDEYLR
jgi:hypothetical protein